MNAAVAPWLVWLFPFLSFIVIALILRPFANRYPRLSGYTAIGGIGLSWAFALRKITGTHLLPASFLISAVA